MSKSKEADYSKPIGVILPTPSAQQSGSGIMPALAQSASAHAPAPAAGPEDPALSPGAGREQVAVTPPQEENQHVVNPALSPPVTPPPNLGRNEYLRRGATLSGPVSDRHPPFYHGHLTKDTCFNVLSPHPIGSYLLRPSSDHTAEYTLSVRTTTGVLNMRVYRRKPDLNFFLDAPEAYRHYSSTVEELINFYQSSEKGIAPIDDQGNIGGSRFHITTPLMLTGHHGQQNAPAASNLRQQTSLQLM